MNKTRPSIYRDGLQVSPERIAAMSDGDLNVLMGQLLRASAYRCDSPINEILVNTEGKAKDDGCDGWSSKPAKPDQWLGSVHTCWQFKAGSGGQPARLAGEVTKRIPKDTLISDGRFVLVASGSTNGKTGEDARLKSLSDDAVTAAIPTEKIEVIGSERLTNWCNQNPATAARWAGRPDGLWTLDDWSNSDEHQVPWQASVTTQSELDARRADLDFQTGSIHHFHIQGPSGVGKTRFALELCREAAWRSSVIYIRQAEDLRLLELIDSVATDTGAHLTVVADEVPAEKLRPLRDSVGRGNGRVRLVTVGHSPSPDPTRIPSLPLKPIDPETMRKIIKGWYPAMPVEHVDFLVRFADGYVRLARLAADAVVRDPAINVMGLLSRDEIRAFLDGMLGTGDRHALYVVAVLTSVGWIDDKQEEGKTIAKHFGFDWNLIQATVHDFHRRFCIAPRGGRYRYISPTPLGVYLAVEAWTIYPDILKSLPDVLPSEGARDAYYERLQSMASNPQARKYASEELAFFFRVDDYVDASTVRRWAALSSADPEEAARNILRALSIASLEDRRRIKDSARRETVGTLLRLVWRSSSFHDAIKALALLAEAENETWANNASREFVARFQILLGGTAVPYLDRMSVLDDLLATNRPALACLAVKALAQIGNQQSFRIGNSPASDELPEKEWQPRTEKEHFECITTAISRLSDIAKRGIVDAQADLVSAAEKLSMALRETPLRGVVADFFDDLHKAYPASREPLRRTIADIIRREKKYWKELSATEMEELERLHNRFEDPTLGARLQQYIGQAPWELEEQPDLKPLAEELLSKLEVLEGNWLWLTSGEASGGWRLGEALAAVDLKGELAEILPSIPGGGHDLRLVCGYVSAQRKTQGGLWYDDWVTSQFERDPKPITLLFEVVWRCGATESIARMLDTILRNEQVNPQIVGQLGYGSWDENIAFDVLETLLRSIADTAHHKTAIQILAHRMKSYPAETERWKTLALDLVTVPDLIRSEHTANYYWKEVCNTLVGEYPGEIAAAIFREQADQESGTWFAEHSNAAGVLLKCVNQDPRRVWQTMLPYLSSPIGAHMFSVGFPRGVLEHIPPDDVDSWIAEKPEERAIMMARLTSKDMSTDKTFVSRLLGNYGENERIANTFFSDYISGIWWGPASEHWSQLADSLETIAERTELPKLRRWAADSARSLRKMAERDQRREEEEELRSR